MKKLIGIILICFAFSLAAESQGYLSWDGTTKTVTLYGKITAWQMISEMETIKLLGKEKYKIEPTFPTLFMQPGITDPYITLTQCHEMELYGNWYVGPLLEWAKTFEFDQESYWVKPTFVAEEKDKKITAEKTENSQRSTGEK